MDLPIPFQFWSRCRLFVEQQSERWYNRNLRGIVVCLTYTGISIKISEWAEHLIRESEHRAVIVAAFRVSFNCNVVITSAGCISFFFFSNALFERKRWWETFKVGNLNSVEG